MMKNKGRFSKRDARAFTLIEVSIALVIFGFVAAAGFLCFEGLQRGNSYISSWSDARAGQIRLFDSLARDFQNTMTYTGSNGTLPLVNNTLPLVLKIPLGYGGYFTSGPRAGDPILTSGTISPSISSTTGKVAYSGTMTVTYSTTTSGSTYTVSRTAAWSSGTATLTSGSTASWTSGTGTRTIASFPNGMSILFSSTSGASLTGSSTETAIVTTITATADNYLLDHAQAVAPSLTNTVFLRAKSIK